MFKSTVSIIILSFLTTGSPAAAQVWEGQRLAELVYGSINGNETDTVEIGQFIAFGKGVFTSMDSDDSGTLTPAEFLDWGFGMHEVAEDAGRSAAFEAGMRVVFSFWDRNGNNELTSAEYRQSLTLDFQRADTNSDAALTKQEFTSGFSVFAASRATIIPTSGN